MLLYWSKLLYPYYSLLLFFPFSSSCRLVLWGRSLRTNRVYLSLALPIFLNNNNTERRQFEVVTWVTIRWQCEVVTWVTIRRQFEVVTWVTIRRQCEVVTWVTVSSQWSNKKRLINFVFRLIGACSSDSSRIVQIIFRLDFDPDI